MAALPDATRFSTKAASAWLIAASTRSVPPPSSSSTRSSVLSIR
jgi:hypothetical protein